MTLALAFALGQLLIVDVFGLSNKFNFLVNVGVLLAFCTFRSHDISFIFSLEFVFA